MDEGCTIKKTQKFYTLAPEGLKSSLSLNTRDRKGAFVRQQYVFVCLPGVFACMAVHLQLCEGQ